MEKRKTFSERRAALLSATQEADETERCSDVASDDWNNFPNYFKFGSFANASVAENDSCKKSD